jgi:hypothetical protein
MYTGHHKLLSLHVAFLAFYPSIIVSINSFTTQYCSVLLSGAAFLDGSILEIWKMNNSGVSTFHCAPFFFPACLLLLMQVIEPLFFLIFRSNY